MEFVNLCIIVLDFSLFIATFYFRENVGPDGAPVIVTNNNAELNFL